MWSNLIAWYYKIEARSYTGTQFRNLILGLIALVFVSKLIFWFFFSYDDVIFSKKNYDKQVKENQKILQQSLSNAEKHKKEADELKAQANYLKTIIDQNKDKLLVKDNLLQEKIKRSDIIREQEIKEITNEYENDLNSINSMSDTERRTDICARLERLASKDNTFSEYQCSEKPR